MAFAVLLLLGLGASGLASRGLWPRAPVSGLCQPGGLWHGGQGLVAGLRVGLACGVLFLPGFGVSSSSPQVPGHATSICDAGVK